MRGRRDGQRHDHRAALTDGPVAVVTGASEGIGLAIARRLAGDGYRVAMVARPSPKLDAAVAGVGPFAFPAGCDVTRPAETEQAVAAVVRSCGRVDALVNCASAIRTGAADSFTDDEWVEAFQVKVFGALRMMRAAWPHHPQREARSSTSAASARARRGTRSR